MPVDPSENLPVAMATLPLVLGGRLLPGAGGPPRRRGVPVPVRGPLAGRLAQEERAAGRAAAEANAAQVTAIWLMPLLCETLFSFVSFGHAAAAGVGASSGSSGTVCPGLVKATLTLCCCPRR